MLSSKEILLERSTAVRKKPLNISPAEESLFMGAAQELILETYLQHYSNVIVTIQGVLIKNFSYVAGSFPEKSIEKKYGLLYLLSTVIRRKKISLSKDKHLLVFNFWSHGYFHWIAEVLPKLYLLREDLHKYVLILPENYPKFVQESLQPFTIKSISYIPANSYFSIKNLHFPTLTANSGSFNEPLIRQLREFYLNYYKTVDLPDFGDRIYVSRKHANRRRVLNEEEVIKTLEFYNFKTICFEDYDFPSQAGICRNARYLISIHGAGLSNMLFMKEESYVMEFRKNNDNSPLCYYAMASALNLNYLYQMCFAEEKQDVQNTDIIVDTVILKKNLELMFNNKN